MFLRVNIPVIKKNSLKSEQNYFMILENRF